VLHRFATRETFSSLALAPDGSTIAAGTSTGEVLVVTADGRAAAARLERGRITCLAFDQTNAISLCAPSQRIVRIPLTALSFESAEKKTVQGDK